MAKRSSGSSKSSTPKVMVDKDSSVSIRQIENGFIVSESGTRGKGRNKEYYDKQWYSKTNPVSIGSGGSANVGRTKFGKR